MKSILFLSFVSSLAFAQPSLLLQRTTFPKLGSGAPTIVCSLYNDHVTITLKAPMFQTEVQTRKLITISEMSALYLGLDQAFGGTVRSRPNNSLGGSTLYLAFNPRTGDSKILLDLESIELPRSKPPAEWSRNDSPVTDSLVLILNTFCNI